jgi:ribose 5-phosphate isomerase B
VVAIGARMNTVEEAREICEVFLTTHFSGAERHARRLAMVERYELHGELPPIPASEG